MSDTPLRMLKVAEAAQIIGISPDQMRRLCKTGKIRTRNTGAMYLISQQALDEYVAGADEPIATAS